MVEIQKPNIPQVTEDVANLIGEWSIKEDITGRLLYKRLTEALAKLSEPYIMILDLHNITITGPSSLELSIVQFVVDNFHNKNKKSIICTNVKDTQRRHLELAIHGRSFENGWIKKDQERVLLPVSGVEGSKDWYILGNLTDQECHLWNLIKDKSCITIAELEKCSGLVSKTLNIHLGIFCNNNVLIRFEFQNQEYICAVPSLIKLKK